MVQKETQWKLLRSSNLPNLLIKVVKVNFRTNHTFQIWEIFLPKHWNSGLINF